MFSRGHHGGHLLAAQRGDRGPRTTSAAAAAESSGKRRTDAAAGGGSGQFRGLKGWSTPRSAADSTRRTLSPPSADAKSPTVPKATTSGTTCGAGGQTIEAFFSVVREGNVDKLRQFLRDTKFDVNARDTVRTVMYIDARLVTNYTVSQKIVPL